MDEESNSVGRTPLSRRRVLRGLAAVGGISAVNIGGFLWAGGWFTPQTLTTSRFVDRFEQVFGRHDGFRRNHAKGLSATGVFTSNGAGTGLSTAAVFRPGTTPVTARFSISGGMPTVADANATVRGLGVLFHMTNGEQWRTAMVNTPVFTDRVPQGFYDRLLATQPVPGTGQPDPVKLAAFLAKYPETARAMALINKTPPSTGLHNSAFHGLNAFRFTNAAGTTVPVRWTVLPDEAFQPVAGAAHPPGQRRHAALARRPPPAAGGHAHHRLGADRGARQRPGRQLRPARATAGHRPVRRPVAGRPLSRLRAVLPAQDSRTPSAQRGQRRNSGNEDGRP
jgi:catalase